MSVRPTAVDARGAAHRGEGGVLGGGGEPAGRNKRRSRALPDNNHAHCCLNKVSFCCGSSSCWLAAYIGPESESENGAQINPATWPI